MSKQLLFAALGGLLALTQPTFAQSGFVFGISCDHGARTTVGAPVLFNQPAGFVSGPTQFVNPNPAFAFAGAPAGTPALATVPVLVGQFTDPKAPPGRTDPATLPPAATSDLIKAIDRLTEQVKQFKNAYQQKNGQPLTVNDSPEQREFDSKLAKLKAAQQGQQAAATAPAAPLSFDEKLARLKRAQAGEATVIVSANR